MILKRCYLTKNRCYTNSPKITNGKPVGIVVHSTGANNKNLKRYVQPLKTDSNYDEVIADIGKNNYGNSWNRSTVSKCVHAMIGANRAGTVETYETLPYDICCWGVGKGKKGSYNYNPTAYIQFEILEDNLKDEGYFNAAFKEAIEYCAYLCKMFNLSVDKICSHKEAGNAGYGSAHGDPDHWLKKFNKDMEWFRSEVKKLLDGKEEEEPTTNTYGKAVVTLRVLGKNSRGESVKSLQILLNAKGYRDSEGKELAIDGIFGADTIYALKSYQKENNLEADGYCGQITWKSIID
jgi:N-acetylmuramoyl-L-alanine amidase